MTRVKIYSEDGWTFWLNEAKTVRPSNAQFRLQDHYITHCCSWTRQLFRGPTRVSSFAGVCFRCKKMIPKSFRYLRLIWAIFFTFGAKTGNWRRL